MKVTVCELSNQPDQFEQDWNALYNHVKGEIKAEARFVRQGKRVTVVRTRVTGAQERLLAEVTTTQIPAT